MPATEVQADCISHRPARHRSPWPPATALAPCGALCHIHAGQMCHADAHRREREPCRSASLAGQAVGNYARRIGEDSRQTPPASGGGWSVRHVWGTSPAKVPQLATPRFMGYRHNGCRRRGRRPSVRRLQGLLVAPCRTATIISIGKRKAPDPSGMVQVLLQITRTHPLAQAACRPARPD